MNSRSTLRLGALSILLGLGLAAAPAQAQDGAWMGVVAAGGSLLTAVGDAVGSQELAAVGQALQRFGTTTAGVLQQGPGALSATGSSPGGLPPIQGQAPPTFTPASSLSLPAAEGEECVDSGTCLLGLATSDVAAAAIGDVAGDAIDDGLDLSQGPGR